MTTGEILVQALTQIGVLIGVVVTLVAGVAAYKKVISGIKSRDVDDTEKLRKVATEIATDLKNTCDEYKKELAEKNKMISELTAYHEVCEAKFNRVQNIVAEVIVILNSVQVDPATAKRLLALQLQLEKVAQPYDSEGGGPISTPAAQKPTSKKKGRK